MMKFHTLKEAARFRISESENNYWIEDYWKAAIETAVRNMDETIRFFHTTVPMRNSTGCRRYLKKLLRKHKAGN